MCVQDRWIFREAIVPLRSVPVDGYVLARDVWTLLGHRRLSHDGNGPGEEVFAKVLRILVVELVPMR